MAWPISTILVFIKSTISRSLSRQLIFMRRSGSLVGQANTPARRRYLQWKEPGIFFTAWPGFYHRQSTWGVVQGFTTARAADQYSKNLIVETENLRAEPAK